MSTQSTARALPPGQGQQQSKAAAPIPATSSSHMRRAPDHTFPLWLYLAVSAEPLPAGRGLPRPVPLLPCSGSECPQDKFLAPRPRARGLPRPDHAQ